MIQAKARDFFEKIKNQQEFSTTSQSQLKENFDAGKSWFYGFEDFQMIMPVKQLKVSRKVAE